MDAFYASVELLRYPELRGQPVVIGGRRVPAADGGVPRLKAYTGRGVITTATYEARALGVHSGMPLMRAARLAPDALLLPADFDEYRRYSRLFKEAVRSIAPHVEDRGIDEIYIDLTALVDTDGADAWDRARSVGVAIQSAVRSRTGLSCSLGITPNKLLSKIASDMEKPGGLTVLREEDIAARIWPLPVRRVNGIGPKAGARLEAIGIKTIGELAQADPEMLVTQFGKSWGAWMHEAAHGRDERQVVTYSEPKSISRETTFDRDLHAVRDRAELGAIFTELCEQLAGDLARKSYAAKTIGVKLRFDDFAIATRDVTLPGHTLDAREIRRAAGSCLKRVDLTRRLRLLGVRASALARLADLVAPLAAEPPAAATVVACEPDPHVRDLPLFGDAS